MQSCRYVFGGFHYENDGFEMHGGGHFVFCGHLDTKSPLRVYTIKYCFFKTFKRKSFVRELISRFIIPFLLVIASYRLQGKLQALIVVLLSSRVVLYGTPHLHYITANLCPLNHRKQCSSCQICFSLCQPSPIYKVRKTANNLKISTENPSITSQWLSQFTAQPSGGSFSAKASEFYYITPLFFSSRTYSIFVLIHLELLTQTKAS